MINLFNFVLTISKLDSRERFPIEISSDEVVRGIHAGLRHLVRETLNIYAKIYPNAEQIVPRLLTNGPAIFDLDMLNKRLRIVNPIKGDLSSDQIRRLLIECGALGVESSRGNLPSSDKILVEGRFEYLAPDTVELDVNLKCIVHPMFYQNFRTRLNT